MNDNNKKVIKLTTTVNTNGFETVRKLKKVKKSSKNELLKEKIDSIDNGNNINNKNLLKRFNKALLLVESLENKILKT